MLVFQIAQLDHQPVKGGVRNFGIICDVIKVFVPPDFFAQALDFFRGVACFLDGMIETWKPQADDSILEFHSIIQCAFANLHGRTWDQDA